MTTTYPDDCLQSAISSDWWVKCDEKGLTRGSLIRAFIPHVDDAPFGFEPIGRKSDDQHDKAIVRVAPLQVDKPLQQTALPVAAMPQFKGEVWAAYRAKVRPCVVLSSTPKAVDKSLTRGKPNHATSTAVLVAPYFGVDQGSKRAGYSDEFIERVRQCEYPQFLWDMLPIGGPEQSLLRLDRIQPLGTHHQSYRSLNYKLSADALSVVDELLQYQIHGGVSENSTFAAYRELIEEMM